jgi:hypothetical protein
MNEDGTDQQLVKDDGMNLVQPKWSLSGSYISMLKVNSSASMANPQNRLTTALPFYMSSSGGVLTEIDNSGVP